MLLLCAIALHLVCLLFSAHFRSPTAGQQLAEEGLLPMTLVPELADAWNNCWTKRFVLSPLSLHDQHASGLLGPSSTSAVRPSILAGTLCAIVKARNGGLKLFFLFRFSVFIKLSSGPKYFCLIVLPKHRLVEHQLSDPISLTFLFCCVFKY